MSRRSLTTVIPLLGVFVGLLIAVKAGGLGAGSVDYRIEGSAHHAVGSHHWLLTAARDVTNLGTALVVDLLTVVAAVALWWKGRRRDAVLVIAVRLITWLLTISIKAAVDRPRPSFTTAFGHWAGASFPSGHASGATSIYLPLAVLAVASLRATWARIATIAGAATVVIFVAASRVLLGAHFTSDVIAGVALGGIVFAVCWATAQQASGRPGQRPQGLPTGKPDGLKWSSQKR